MSNRITPRDRFPKSHTQGERLIDWLKYRYGDGFQGLFLLEVECAGDGTEEVCRFAALIEGMPPISGFFHAGYTNEPAIDDLEALLYSDDEPLLPFSVQYYSAPGDWTPPRGWQQIEPRNEGDPLQRLRESVQRYHRPFDPISGESEGL